MGEEAVTDAVPGSVPRGGKGYYVAVVAILFYSLTSFEGMERVPVHEHADPKNVYTYCNGLTNVGVKVEVDNLIPGHRYSDAECEKILRQVLPTYFADMEKVIHVYMPPHRAAAFLDFTYNEGAGNLAKSRMVRDLNAGNAAQACADFTEGHHYDIANHRHLSGLQKRRQWERGQCERGD